MTDAKRVTSFGRGVSRTKETISETPHGDRVCKSGVMPHTALGDAHTEPCRASALRSVVRRDLQRRSAPGQLARYGAADVQWGADLRRYIGSRRSSRRRRVPTDEIEAALPSVNLVGFELTGRNRQNRVIRQFSNSDAISFKIATGL